MNFYFNLNKETLAKIALIEKMIKETINKDVNTLNTEQMSLDKKSGVKKRILKFNRRSSLEQQIIEKIK